MRVRCTLSRGTGTKTACRRLRWEKEFFRSCEPGTGILARVARVYAASKDAASLRGGRQVAAGCSLPVGEEVVCRAVRRLWSEVPGEVFGAANSLCKHRDAAGWSAAFGENYGARRPPWDEQGL